MTCDERFLFRDGDCGAGTMGRGDPLGSADNRPGSPHGMTAVMQCCMQLLKASCPGHYWLHGEQFLVNNNYLRVPETSSKLDV